MLIWKKSAIFIHEEIENGKTGYKPKRVSFRDYR